MDQAQLDRIEKKLDALLAIWERFKPLIERYEHSNMFGKRKLKGL